MPMTEARAGDQAVRYDRQATAAAYAGLKYGSAEECGCVFCRNFAVQRDGVYPASFRGLLGQIGIDAGKEFEVFEYGPAGEGRHRCGGRFYFVREMVAWGERNVNPPGSLQAAADFSPPISSFARSRAEALRRLESALLHRPGAKDTRPR